MWKRQAQNKLAEITKTEFLMSLRQETHKNNQDDYGYDARKKDQP